MFSSLLKKVKVPAIIRRAAKDESGATAIEFAIVGPVFLSLVFSAMEVGLLMTKNALLENAASTISRSIYTGSVTNGALTREDLIETVCEAISIIDSSCAENVSIELTPIANFQAIPNSDAQCTDSAQPVNPVVDFIPGAGNSIVYMRICLSTNIYTPGIGFGSQLTQTSTGKFELVTAIAFANEPF